jgi:hypothetical protein
MPKLNTRLRIRRSFRFRCWLSEQFFMPNPIKKSTNELRIIRETKRQSQKA